MNEGIRIRASLAVMQEDRILLVPHYYSSHEPVQWYIPGGSIKFGEAMQDAAMREFYEETGFHARVEKLLDVSELLEPEKPWHSITITFFGTIFDGTLTAEHQHFSSQYGDKTPRWFSFQELQSIKYRPPSAVKAAFALVSKGHGCE